MVSMISMKAVLTYENFPRTSPLMNYAKVDEVCQYWPSKNPNIVMLWFIGKRAKFLENWEWSALIIVNSGSVKRVFIHFIGRYELEK